MKFNISLKTKMLDSNGILMQNWVSKSVKALEDTPPEYRSMNFSVTSISLYK